MPAPFSFAAAQRIVIISTHLIEDIVHVADSIQVLQDGRGVWSGTPAALERFADNTLGAGLSRADQGLLQILGADRPGGAA